MPVRVVGFGRIPVQQRVTSKVVIERDREGDVMLISIALPDRATKALAGILRGPQTRSVNSRKSRKSSPLVYQKSKMASRSSGPRSLIAAIPTGVFAEA